MNFELPPLNESSTSVPDLSEEELAAAPSTTLMSLANSMSASLSELHSEATTLKTRYDKISAEISTLGSGGGRTLVDNISSLASIGTSISESIGPVKSTVSIMGDIKDTGSDMLTNTEEAGSTPEDAQDFTTKIGDYYEDLTSGF
tara:strand:+ start:10393 stop:10827 length:435 start_codon:yes stop_codon:yes gene_type:complete